MLKARKFSFMWPDGQFWYHCYMLNPPKPPPSQEITLTVWYKVLLKGSPWNQSRSQFWGSNFLSCLTLTWWCVQKCDDLEAVIRTCQQSKTAKTRRNSPLFLGWPTKNGVGQSLVIIEPSVRAVRRRSKWYLTDPFKWGHLSDLPYSAQKRVDT